MGNVEFSYKEISEEPPSTTESVEEIENNKIIAEFRNEEAMWKAYTEIGAVEFLGDMTEKGMANLFDKTENVENIRYELIPEQLTKEGGMEYKVYQITKNYDPDSSAAQEIARNEYNCYVEIQEKTTQEYESLVEAGKMNNLGVLTPEKLTECKTNNNILDKDIREVSCFDENGNVIEKSRLYYEIIN